jgi:hypothetical protein
MANRYRDFFILVIVTAAAVTPALGQDVAPAITAANSGTQSATAIPDFSGTWAQLFCCGFAPPLTGPGPVTNRSRRDGASDFHAFVGDYTNPILKPQAAEIVQRHGDTEARGVPYPNPRNQCWPEGVPFVLSNFGMTVIQRPDEITILYDHDHQVRHVRMNQLHPTDVTPSWYGDSVGHYDGDKLVIDTVGVKIGPFAMIDWYGTPHTEALHVVERYRLIEYEAAKEAEERTAREFRRLPTGNGLAPDPNYRGKALQLQFTVEDAGVFTMPWSSIITRRRSFAEWPEYVCAESLRGIDAAKDSAVPHAEKPDF